MTNVTVNATGGPNGAIATSSIDRVSVELYNNSTSLVDSESAPYDSQNTTVRFGENVTNVDRIVVRAQVSSTAVDGEVIDANLYVQTNPTGFVQTANEQPVVVNDNGFISGRVSDQNNNDIQNATVRVFNNTRGFSKTTQTNSEGDYTIEVPPGSYEVVAQKPGFSTAQPKDTTVNANQTTTANFVLRRLLLADNIVVDPKEDSAQVGENNSFTVTVFDQNGDPLDGATVEASVVDSTSGITFVSADTQSTDADGQATFVVTSDEVETNKDILFEVTSSTENNEPVNTTATKSFVLNGEGEIDGTIQNSATTDPVENASVWAVLNSTFRSNTVETSVNVNNDSTGVDVAVNDSDGVIYFRLVDNASGQILDVNDDYRVQTPNASDTAIRPLSAVNTTNESVGEGFAVIDLDGDGNVTFGHTRIDPEQYYAQVSLTAPNNSDIDEVGNADNPPEAFINVSEGAVLGGADGGDADTTVDGAEGFVFSPTTDLSLSATEERAEATGANQVDSPGFVNSYGVDTAGTNENGQFKLDKLFTNFQEGRNYTVIADKVGFDREYGEVFVTEDGAKFTNSPFQGLNLEPEPVEPDAVNITQIGTHPPLAQTGGQPDPTLITPFDDQSDATFQRVSRDNTIDVIQVETLSDGTPANGTAVVEIAEYNFTDAADDENIEGDFVGVLGGTNVSGGAPGSDTITVNTGDDGVATVLYETDRSSSTVSANKTATLTNDRSATDGSNATFVGVTAFQSASISGIVTDRDNTRVPFSVAYVKSFYVGDRTTASQRFTFTPLTNAPEDSPAFGDYVDINKNPDSLWAVELQEFNQTTGQFETVRQVNVTTTTLDEYNFDQLENDFPSVEVLPSVRARAGTDGFDFYDTTTEGADYTLDPLPAVAEVGNRGQTVETDYTVEGVRLNEAGTQDDDIAGVDANDGLAELFVNTTDDANLVLPFQVEQADYELSNLQAPTNASGGENITVNATVTNVGGTIDSEANVSFRIDLNQNGALEADEVVASTTVDLAPGTSDTVEFTVSTAGVPSGTYEHGFVVPGDAEVTATITIDGGQQDIVAQYDTNNDGAIQPGEAQSAIADLNNGEITPSEAQQIIAALNNS